MDERFERLVTERGPEQLQHILDGVAQLERPALQFDLARFDLGKVQDVVDHDEQGGAGATDSFGVLLLLGALLRLREQVGHADHPVEGRADLVAHHGEELRLGEGGVLRFDRQALGFLERVLQMDSLPPDCAPAPPDQAHRTQEETGKAQAENQERGPAESIDVGRDVRDRERIGGLQCPRHHGHPMLL